jgi:hypothetical protein
MASWTFARASCSVEPWDAQPGKPIFPRRASKGFNKAPLFLIGVDAAKERVYSRLRVTEPAAGYCHFPITHPRDYFDMLTGERITTRMRNGFPERIWIKPSGVRNEVLDARAYCLAAPHGLYMAGLKLADHCDRFTAMLTGKPATAQYEVYRSRFVSG